MFAPALSSDEGFKDAYFHQLADLEARNFWFRARNRLITWAIRRYFPAAGNFLEIGCGTGYVLSGIGKANPGLALSGSEINYGGLPYARTRVPAAELFQMDARTVPFEDEFDAIGAFDVLEHIENDAAVLEQLHQAARSSGGILVTVPQHKFLWSGQDVRACHVRRYTMPEIRAKVEAAGFEVVRMTSFVSLLFPAMAVSRLLHRKHEDRFDAMDELRLPAWVNWLFDRVLMLERAAIQSGIDFPFGGSVLVIARKR
jgi:SAM-dependent methyltransferase